MRNPEEWDKPFRWDWRYECRSCEKGYRYWRPEPGDWLPSVEMAKKWRRYWASGMTIREIAEHEDVPLVTVGVMVERTRVYLIDRGLDPVGKGAH